MKELSKKNFIFYINAYRTINRKQLNSRANEKMLQHSFWRKENQCWPQNLHRHCGSDNYEICIMINNKNEAIFYYKNCQTKIILKGKEAQNNFSVTALKKPRKINKQVGSRIEILTSIMQYLE